MTKSTGKVLWMKGPTSPARNPQGGGCMRGPVCGLPGRGLEGIPDALSPARFDCASWEGRTQ